MDYNSYNREDMRYIKLQLWFWRMCWGKVASCSLSKLTCTDSKKITFAWLLLASKLWQVIIEGKLFNQKNCRKGWEVTRVVSGGKQEPTAKISMGYLDYINSKRWNSLLCVILIKANPKWKICSAFPKHFINLWEYLTEW